MIRSTLFAGILAWFSAALFPAHGAPVTPRIAGEWWTIATDPDLGALTNTKQQPVDFAIWQAADGTWQLWSCIRGTREPGNTRLFHRWEGAHLRDTNWRSKGIAMQADPELGETRGGLQAPYVFRHDGRYWMVYGDWAHICLATSDDGKRFVRHRGANGRPQLFGRGPSDNTRDPMVLRVGDKWHCYYTAHPDRHGSVYARVSTNLLDWSQERIVAARGQAGDGPYAAECPFVVEPRPGDFYLFRTQRYGRNAQTSVYHSPRELSGLDFGIDNDAEHFVCTLPVAAPEIFQFEGRWFIAALLPSLKGIQVAPLEWVAGAEK